MADNHVPGASCQFLKINSPFHLLYLPFIRKGLKINPSKVRMESCKDTVNKKRIVI